MIRVAVAGAAGRMGQTVCEAVEGAQDMELSGRADPLLGVTLKDVLADAQVVVDFTQPHTALKRVDLPEPDGPMIEINSPRSTSKEMWLRAVTSPA